MDKQKRNRNNLTDIRNNTRVRTVKLVKDTLAQLRGDLEAEIARLNSDSARPIHLVNDLAGGSVGETYLQAPENITSTDEAYAVQVGRLIQDIKQVERRALRLEQMSKGQA